MPMHPLRPALRTFEAASPGSAAVGEVPPPRALMELPDPPALSANAVTVLERRYLIRDERGRAVETPAEMFRRVARAVALAEERYNQSPIHPSEIEERFFSRLARTEFLPNSPTLMNAGRSLG